MDNDQRKERALAQVESLHSKVDVLQDKLAVIRRLRPDEAASASGYIWLLNGGQGLKGPNCEAGVKSKIKRLEKTTYKAGLLEDEAERLLYSVDAIDSDGDHDIRRQRKGLVLRIKNLMKRAGWLARESELAKRLRAALEAYEQRCHPLDSMDSKGESVENGDDDDHVDAESDHHSNDDDDFQPMEEATPQRIEEQDLEEVDAEPEPEPEPAVSERKPAQRMMQKRKWNPKFHQTSDRLGNVHLIAKLPGVSRDQLEISLDQKQRSVEIRAVSKSHGYLEKNIEVSRDFNLAETRAQFEDGQLHITFVPALELDQAHYHHPYQQRSHYRNPYNRQQHGSRQRDPFFGGGGFFGSPMMAW